MLHLKTDASKYKWTFDGSQKNAKLMPNNNIKF